MDIESYCSKPVSGFCDNFANKQIANLLPGMIKKKGNKQYENIVPAICLPMQFNNDKYHYGSKLYCLLKMRNSDCHSRNGRDVILIQALSPDKIENTVCQNNIYQYDLCKNTGNTRPDKISANVIPAEKPEIIPVKSTPAESSQAENTQAESIQAESIQAESTQAESIQTERSQTESSQTELSQTEKTQAESVQAEYRPGSDCADSGVNPAQVIVPVLPELPAFRISDIPPERKHLPLWQYVQEKTSQITSHTGKPPVSPESSKPDYYCSYYFRQKHQPPEPVIIYREKPGRFKLETYSDPLNRRLKSIVNINGINNIDIL